MNLIFRFLKTFNISKSTFILRHLICFIPALITTISSIIFPNFIRLIIDNGITTNNNASLIFYCFLMCLCGLVMVIFSYLENNLYLEFQQNIYLELKTKIFKKILSSNDNTFITNNKTGELYTILESDLSNITSLITDLFPSLITGICTLIGVSYFIIRYFSIFGVIIVVFSFVLISFQRFFGNKIEKYVSESRINVGDLASFTQESLANISNISMTGYTDYIIEKYLKKSNTVRYSTIKQVKIQNSSRVFRLGANTLTLLFVLVIGAFMVNTGNMELGSLFSLSIYAQRSTSPINLIIQNYLMVKKNTPYLYRAVDLYNSTGGNEKGHEYPHKAISSIEISNLNFNYPGEIHNIFYNFNNYINKGEIIGIIGSNGMGKSTLLKILFKQCKIQENIVIINDIIDLNDIDTDYLHENISFVPQKAFLISGELREVLNPFKKNLTDESLIDIIEQVGLNFNLFESKLDYNISENTLNLSGGEVQKIAIAKMLIEDKPWIFMDEPTAHMDLDSEKKICELLSDYFRNKTSIIITHRQEILKICTRIINLNDKDCLSIQEERRTI